MARILVADDDRPLRDALRTTLELDGHDVVLAANGDEAFRLYQEGGFELVITDLYMPHMDGIELIMSLRQKNSDATILAMSGIEPNGRPDYLNAAMDFGASAAIRKPFTGPALLSKVHEVLDHAAP